MIAGEAGTGKSATIEAMREAYQEAGYRVPGLAWTNAVVQDMKRDGFTDAATIASEMKRQERARANGTRARCSSSTRRPCFRPSIWPK